MSGNSQRANNVNPSMLVWARQTAGLSEELAAQSVGLSTSSRSSAAEKLAAIESGTTRPTRLQLMRVAAAYRRPPTVFYLASPPTPGPRGEDFRTAPDAPQSSQDSALLGALLRDIRVRQSILRAALEDDEDWRRPELGRLLSLEDGIPNAVAAMRRALGVPDHDWGRRMKPGDAFGWLRSRVEKLGAFVLLAGDLGSHHSAVSERVFRGFALADAVAPFVVVNYQDAVIARPFTLLHELAHICLGATGVSAAPPSARPSRDHDRIELFCNDVASEFLLPDEALSMSRQMRTFDAAQEWISPVAENWRVSEAMIAYRLWRRERIARDVYRRLHAFYARRWQNARERERIERREVEGGPTYYVVRRHRLGGALLSQTRRLLQTEEIAHTKAARILGVKLGSVEPLLRGISDVEHPLDF